MVARRDIHGAMGPLGHPAVKRGTRGIVPSGPAGLLSTSYEVEFIHGRTMHVHSRDLRATFGHGEAYWERHRTVHTAIQWAFFILMIPVILGIIRYYQRGGTTSGLIAGLPGAMAHSLVSLFSDALGLVGLPVVLGVLAALWFVRRSRH